MVQEDKCCTYYILHRVVRDHAFMGRTHALSALAIFFILLAFIGDFFNTILGTTSPWGIIGAAIVIIGASLIPDLDNTHSTAKSTLGVIGSGLSIIMKSSSVLIQGIVSTKYDKDSSNPHRKLWHTPIIWLLVGLGLLGLFSLSTVISLPIIGEMTLGGIFAFLILYVSMQLTLMGLLTSTMKGLKKKHGFMGEVVVDGIALVFTFLVFNQILESNINGYQWLAASFTIGAWIHILGDLMTTMGVPLLFPIKIKGKFWYNIRFLPIQAGGVIENYIFTPVFIVMIIFSVIKLYGLF